MKILRLEYETRETIKGIGLVAFLIMVISIAIWVVRDARRIEDEFRASITPELRVQLDTKSQALIAAPLRTLIVYSDPDLSWFRSTIGVLGAHDLPKGSEHMRLINPCALGEPYFYDLHRDHLLVGVEKIVKPGEPGYEELAMKCFELMQVTRIGSRPLDSYK